MRSTRSRLKRRELIGEPPGGLRAAVAVVGKEGRKGVQAVQRADPPGACRLGQARAQRARVLPRPVRPKGESSQARRIGEQGPARLPGKGELNGVLSHSHQAKLAP